MKRFAFSMLELVFVIVVIGILAVALIPQYERDNISEAAYQVARHIRLAQHHAMVEDRVNDPSPANWQGTLWRITFVSGTKGECYQVHADRDLNGGNPAADERAVDPLTRRYIWGDTSCSDTNADVNDDVLLWKSFGVTNLTVCGGGGAKHIAFDFLGTPGRITGTNFTELPADCVINIETDNGAHDADITIYEKTGAVKVTRIDSTTF